MTSTADQKNLLEVLEELLLDPGWHVWKAHVNNEWGPQGYRTRVQAALQAEMGGQFGQLHPHAAVIVVEAMTREIERLLQWPEEQVSRLRARASEAKMTTTAGPRA